jgi:UDP-N-acetylmuramoylalanine--D-glutamate ligase
MAAYVRAKASVFGQHGVMVLNRDDEQVMAMLPPRAPKLQKPQQRACVLFGGDMPQRPGDFGIEVVQRHGLAGTGARRDETKRRRSEAAPELFFQRLMPADACASVAATTPSTPCRRWRWQRRWLRAGTMLYGLREYTGRTAPGAADRHGGGTEYFDDSKGTNVGATVAALQGLGRPQGGGDSWW